MYLLSRFRHISAFCHVEFFSINSHTLSYQGVRSLLLYLCAVIVRSTKGNSQFKKKIHVTVFKALELSYNTRVSAFGAMSTRSRFF